MTATVRLTIDVPAELRRRAEARAQMEGRSMASVLIERLEEYAAGFDAGGEDGEAEDVRAVDDIEARVARGEEAVVDWATVDAELNALPR